MPSARLLGSTTHIAAFSTTSTPSPPSPLAPETPASVAPCVSRPQPYPAPPSPARMSRRMAFTLDLFAVSVVHPRATPHSMLCTVCAVRRGFVFVTAARSISISFSAGSSSSGVGMPSLPSPTTAGDAREDRGLDSVRGSGIVSCARMSQHVRARTLKNGDRARPSSDSVGGSMSAPGTDASNTRIGIRGRNARG